MNVNTHNEPMPTKAIATEFASWPMTTEGVEAANNIRMAFDNLLTLITNHTPEGNGRYLSLVKTKLEEASFYAVKGIAKPVNS
jgi:hypothetical protein